jgi:hypothetical protein
LQSRLLDDVFGLLVVAQHASRNPVKIAVVTTNHSRSSIATAWSTRIDDLVAETLTTYDGPLEIGEDLMCFEIGDR